MDISGIPDLLHLCQNDIDKTLYGIEKFVKRSAQRKQSTFKAESIRKDSSAKSTLPFLKEARNHINFFRN